jgi:hypothetical protein
MDGLAYSVPVYEVIESDTIEDFEEEILPNNNNNKGTGYGKSFNRKPYKTAGSNFRTWSGTISGNVRAMVENDLATCNGANLGQIDIPVYDIRVTVMDKDPIGFGCFLGVDDNLGSDYTDQNGNFSVGFISNQRYKGGLVSCAREGDNLEIYLIIEARNADNTIRVVKRLGGTRDITITKSNPIGYHYNSSSLNFGNIFPSTSGVKAQLLTWAGHCRNLANTVYGMPASNDPLEIMIFPLTQKEGAMFIPGGVKNDILALAALGSIVFPPLGFVSSATLGLYLTNSDCIYMGEDSELNEDVTYHEFGHYFMWHLQGQSWLNPLDASFASHGLAYNSRDVRLAWTEGFAEGFSQIADGSFRLLDNEFGTDRICFDGGSTFTYNYEQRTRNGTKPEFLGAVFVDRNGTVALEKVLTHGYVSELNIASILFDLFDGNPIIADNDGSRVVPGSSPVLSIANDSVAFNLAQICQPILNKRGTGGYINQGQYLINNIEQYFEELIKLHNCNKRRELADLFLFDRISDFPDPNQDILNTDAISTTNTIAFDQFKYKGSATADYKHKGTEFRTFNLDNNTLESAQVSVNFGYTLNLGSEFISDNLTVSDNALLSFNRNLPRGYAFAPQSNPPQGSTLNVDVCGKMRLNVIQNGRVDLGDNATANIANVNIQNVGLFHFQNGSTLTINNGSTLFVQGGGTLYIRSGANVILNGTARIIVQPGAFVCIENGATITGDPQSEISISPFSNFGVNPFLGLGATSCSNQIAFCGKLTGGSAMSLSNAEALRFDGVNDVVTIPDQTRLNLGANPFTWEAIIRSTHTNGFGNIETIMSKRSFASGSVADGFIFGVWSGGQMFVQMAGAPNILDDNIGFGYNLYDGDCHHVALTRNGNTLQFYVDGQPTGTFATSRNINSTGNILRIGRNGITGLFFNGQIGEIRIWDDLRDAGEIEDNINSNAALLISEGNLIALWDMTNGTQTLTDISGVLPAANGFLGTSGIADASDPTWMALCTNCTNPLINNFRMASNGNIAEDLNTSLGVDIYPNPFTNTINLIVSGQEEQVKISVENINGIEVYSKDAHQVNEILSFGEDFSAGIYFVTIISGSDVKILKVIKAN